MDSVSCSVMDYEDVEDGEHRMELSSEEKYLGMVISKDGSNKANIKSKVSRGLGAINEIMSILEENCFGKYNFEVLTTLRNSLFINSILSNSASWYNLKKEDLKRLEN